MKKILLTLALLFALSPVCLAVSVQCEVCGNVSEPLLVIQLCEDTTSDAFCSNCGGIKPHFVPGLGHSLITEEIRAATCELSGSKRNVCTRVNCEYVSSLMEIPALGHSYTPTVLSNPTCTDSGITRYTCDRSDCGLFYDDVVPALGHILSATVTDATCTSSGSKISSCSRCTYSVTETIAALGHSTTTVVTDATCTTDGSKVTTCSRCDYSSSETIALFGHDWEETSRSEPTYTSNGCIVSTCARCSETMTESIPMLDASTCTHTWVEVGRIEPTYSTTGRIDYECSSCGSSMSDILPVLDSAVCVHQFVEESVVEPTYESDGMITYRCSSCGSTKVVRIPMLSDDEEDDSILTDLKLAVQSLFGIYEPIMTTHVSVTSSASEVNQVLTTGVAEGAAGVDYEYLAGVFLFLVLLYCVLRLFGGVLKTWRT